MYTHIIVSDTAKFEADVLKSELPVVVYIYSDDCHPCLTFTQIFERTASTLSDQVRFVKIFRPHNRSLADQYAIKSSPTVMFFKSGKEICARLTGYINHPEFKSAIENLIERPCPTRGRNVVRCDVLIIGGGPAGFTAAIYTSRSKLYTVIIDSTIPGGQVASTYHISNYPGTNGVVRGLDLMDNMKNQALSFGTQIDDMQEITEIDLAGNEKIVRTRDHDYFAKAVIIATGAEPRKLPVEGERDYRSRGVHYCATCDGALYTDADVLVVGGGTSAVEEAVFLTRYAKKVTLVNRSHVFKYSKTSLDDILKNPLISVLWDTIVKEISGEQFLQKVVLENVLTGERQEQDTDAIFVYIGSQPNTERFKDQIKLNDYGYILTNEMMMTNLSGVFAAGDVREKEIRQITTSVGDGTIAGIMAERFITAQG